jgi:gentisate 1,2-dioxygenase
MREDVIGRANVEDNPELDRYYETLDKESAYALWTIANKIEPWFPKSKSIATLWKYQELRPLVIKALDLVSPEKAGRRVIALENPARKGFSACVGLLYTGLQVTRPGEFTSAHRHAACALRFVIEGKGAYTVVDGHKISLNPGDFVITPKDSWHDHGVDTDGETTIWQDGLDMLMVNELEANFYAVHPEVRQTATYPLNDMPALYGGAGLIPDGAAWSKPYSPMMRYEWATTYEALVKASKVSEGSPFDGTYMHYSNPATGSPVMQTLGASIQLLRAGEATHAHRHTGSVCYTVAKGSGHSVIDGQRFDWNKNDIFVVPPWAIHEHANQSASEDAVLFSFHDLPTMRTLGLYKEEAYTENGGHQAITA